jgi:putative inorganic carbon (HCO3(-)) transporter
MILTLLVVGLGVLFVAGGQQQSQTVVGEMASTGTLAFRQQVWRIATWMMSDFPFTGVGMGTFNDVAVRLYPFPDVPDPGAHNLFLQTGVDLGFPGLIAYLAILILALFMSLSSIAELDRQGDIPLWAMSIGLFAGTVALIFHGLVDITVWGTRAAFVPWLIIGLITAVHIYVISKNSEINT